MLTIHDNSAASQSQKLMAHYSQFPKIPPLCHTFAVPHLMSHDPSSLPPCKVCVRTSEVGELNLGGAVGGGGMLGSHTQCRNWFWDGGTAFLHPQPCLVVSSVLAESASCSVGTSFLPSWTLIQWGQMEDSLSKGWRQGRALWGQKDRKSCQHSSVGRRSHLQ